MPRKDNRESVVNVCPHCFTGIKNKKCVSCKRHFPATLSELENLESADRKKRMGVND